MILLFLLPTVAGMTGMPPCPDFSVEIRFYELFTQDDFELASSRLASCIAGMASLCYHAQLLVELRVS
jgi:hypothetical protein